MGQFITDQTFINLSICWHCIVEQRSKYLPLNTNLEIKKKEGRIKKPWITLPMVYQVLFHSHWRKGITVPEMKLFSAEELDKYHTGWHAGLIQQLLETFCCSYCSAIMWASLRKLWLQIKSRGLIYKHCAHTLSMKRLETIFFLNAYVYGDFSPCARTFWRREKVATHMVRCWTEATSISYI